MGQMLRRVAALRDVARTLYRRALAASCAYLGHDWDVTRQRGDAFVLKCESCGDSYAIESSRHVDRAPFCERCGKSAWPLLGVCRACRGWDEARPSAFKGEQK